MSDGSRTSLSTLLNKLGLTKHLSTFVNEDLDVQRLQSMGEHMYGHLVNDLGLSQADAGRLMTALIDADPEDRSLVLDKIDGASSAVVSDLHTNFTADADLEMVSDAEYKKGDYIILHGLQAKPELNGKEAEVVGPAKDGRHPIRLSGKITGGKVVKILVKPEHFLKQEPNNNNEDDDDDDGFSHGDAGKLTTPIDARIYGPYGYLQGHGPTPSWTRASLADSDELDPFKQFDEQNSPVEVGQ
eukprot:CAMPEP_0119309122 /NCGR_PEP_ID=MMETSP1333-20130426/14264_1 /TAXON_ID=418940 /ORGANISM="Scyphosphaera apsteinii, Strain RCC1455" /LENGTH=242 /DNA_ID=CAMNT_0007313045 /DNA_START=15 /DNA_END=743 /DNA_ORIENTATION=-